MFCQHLNPLCPLAICRAVDNGSGEWKQNVGMGLCKPNYDTLTALTMTY